MYSNVETGLGKALPQDSPDENPYEPLDPSPTPAPPPLALSPSPSHKGRGLGGRGLCGRGRGVALVALVALGVSLLLNVILVTLGARRVSELSAALEAEKAKEPEPPTGSATFQLYNQAHQGCIVATNRRLSLARCVPSSPAQLFQWLPGGQLRQPSSGHCVTATAAVAQALVRLAPCRAGWRLQRWLCGHGALLALAGTELHFNFGNNREGEVMLFAGKGEWSRWVASGSGEDLCSRDCHPRCSKGWVFFRNSCYFFSKSATSWENSRLFCSALGSQLLEVDDAEEKQHVQAQLQRPAWLGIRDEEQEGSWRKGDGTALTPNNSWWHRDEPNGGSLENCAAVGPDGLWADYPCGASLAWVCEEPS